MSPLADRIPHRSHTFGIMLSAIVIFGFAARSGYILSVGQRLTFGLDSIWYELQAGTIANGVGYVDPGAYYRFGQHIPTANFPPLWPLVLAISNKVGGHTETDFQFVGAVVGSITVALTGFLGRRVAGRHVGLAAALIVAVCPMLIAADGSIMSDSLYVTLVTAALVASYRALDRPNLVRFGFVGLLVGLATLTRSDGLFLALVLAVALTCKVRSPSTGRRVALGACMLGMVVVTQLPWVVSSSTQMGGLVVMSSNSGSALEGANCPTTYSGPLIGGWDARCQQKVRAPGKSELQWTAAARDEGIRYALMNPSRLPLVIAARALRVWGLWPPVEQARLESIESRNETWQLVGWAYDLLVLAVSVPGIVILFRGKETIAPLAAVVISVIVTAVLSYGNQRFRLAAEPAMAVAAATAMVSFWQALATRRTSGGRDADSGLGISLLEGASDPGH